MKKNKTENVWLNIGCNIIIPSILLVKGRSIAEKFSLDCSNIDIWVFVIALLFPIVYGIWDLVSRQKWNMISIIGLASIVLTGGVGLMKLPTEWIIVKEGAIPLLLGAVVLATAYTKRPLAKMIILSESVFDVEKIDNALQERNANDEFDKQMKNITYIVAASFLLSSVLNFILAYYIFESPAGTPEFNEEVGKMTALSFPVIALPTTIIFIFAMMKFFKILTRLTGLSLEDIMLKK